jgi:dihydrofolate reductase
MIKVIAIWTQSLDGYIAKTADDDLSWGKQVDKQWFSKVTRDIGVVVMGRKTAELIGKPLPGRLNMVMSRSLGKTPKQILEELEKQGFKDVAICGGASIYTLWLREKLVDEVWLSVQPVIFGGGIKPVERVEMKLEFLEQEGIGEGVVVMKYEV